MSPRRLTRAIYVTPAGRDALERAIAALAWRTTERAMLDGLSAIRASYDAADPGERIVDRAYDDAVAERWAVSP